jgi:hypothetical protein
MMQLALPIGLTGNRYVTSRSPAFRAKLAPNLETNGIPPTSERNKKSPLRSRSFRGLVHVGRASASSDVWGWVHTPRGTVALRKTTDSQRS